jgi:hypothetical protein
VGTWVASRVEHRLAVRERAAGASDPTCRHWVGAGTRAHDVCWVGEGPGAHDV